MRLSTGFGKLGLAEGTRGSALGPAAQKGTRLTDLVNLVIGKVKKLINSPSRTQNTLCLAARGQRRGDIPVNLSSRPSWAGEIRGAHRKCWFNPGSSTRFRGFCQGQSRSSSRVHSLQTVMIHKANQLLSTTENPVSQRWTEANVVKGQRF